MDPKPKKSNALLIVLVIVIAIPALFVIVGTVAALGIYGVRSYLTNAKEAEGRSMVQRIARGAVQCSARVRDDGTQSLPVTTTPVPATLDSVSARKYMSSPGDWMAPGWDCIKQGLMDPQYFQYRWTRTSPTEGVASAVADFDGDLTADVTFEVPVTCSQSPKLVCTVGTLREVP